MGRIPLNEGYEEWRKLNIEKIRARFTKLYDDLLLEQKEIANQNPETR